MPDNNNKNDKNQNQTQKQGNQAQQGGSQRQGMGNQGQQGNQGNIDRDKGNQDIGGGRQVQSDKGNQAGKQGSTNIEDNDVSQVSNDNDLDRDLDTDDNDNDEVTQRNPRMGDQGQSGTQVGRNQGQNNDRDRK